MKQAGGNVAFVDNKTKTTTTDDFHKSWDKTWNTNQPVKRWRSIPSVTTRGRTCSWGGFTHYVMIPVFLRAVKVRSGPKSLKFPKYFVRICFVCDAQRVFYILLFIVFSFFNCHVKRFVAAFVRLASLVI